MRTQLLCALALLCGAGVVHAQGWAGSDTYGNSQGYPPNPYAMGYAGYQMPPGAGYAGDPNAAAVQPVQGYMPPGAQAMPAGPVNYGDMGGGPYPAGPIVGSGYGYPPFAGQPAPIQPAIDPPLAPPPLTEPVYSLNDPPLARYCLWGSVDSMFSWIRRERLNTPLVTVGSATDNQPGALGQPGTGIVFGDSVNYNQLNGVRVDLGTFLDDERRLSLEWVGQFFGTSSIQSLTASDMTGNPIIARPFFNTVTNMPAAAKISFPGFLAGSVGVNATTHLVGSEFNAGYLLLCGPAFRLDGLIGFRYLHMGESLDITDNVQSLPNAAFPPGTSALTFLGQPVPLPNSVVELDMFRTRNTFYGVNVGGRFRWDCSWLFMTGYAKLGLGATDQTVDIKGTTTLVTPTGTTTVPGAILAQTSNIGDRHRSVFSITPDIGLNIGVKLTSHVQLTAGYSFLVWTNVVRPGRQIDPSVNPTLVPAGDATFGQGLGPVRPVFNFKDETVWIHSLLLGLSFQY